MKTIINFDPIRTWAKDRNLIDGSDAKSQTVKLMEEVGELASGVAKNKIDVVADSIGDCVVVLTILAEQHGLTIEDCIADAYQEIKDRKGRMISGVFVKEEDLTIDEPKVDPAIAIFLQEYPELKTQIDVLVDCELRNLQKFEVSFSAYSELKKLPYFLELTSAMGYYHSRRYNFLCNDTYTFQKFAGN